MKKHIKLVCVLSVLWFAQCASAAATSPAVIVQAGYGTTVVGRGVVKAGALLDVGGHLLTSAGSTAQMRLSDGSALMIAPASDVGINTYNYGSDANNPRYAQLSLTEGQLRVVTGAISKSAPGQFSVLTPYGLFTAYGTDFTVAICNAVCAAKKGIAEGAYLHVDDGKVNASGRNGSADFAAGESGMLSVAGAAVLLDDIPEGLFNVPTTVIIPLPPGGNGAPAIPNLRIDPAVPASPAS